MTKILIRIDGEVQAVDSADGYEGFELIGPAPDGVDPAAVQFDESGAPDHSPAWTAMRAERDRRLLACDWTQLDDVPEETRSAWAPYRQALRDLPAETANPLNPEWPAPPGD